MYIDMSNPADATFDVLDGRHYALEPLLSVVIPVYNEEDNVRLMLESIYKAVGHLPYELILVDDGSTDRTLEIARIYGNENTRIVSLRRNYGQTSAMSAGISLANGRYVATLDGDLQNDPGDIPALLGHALEGGWDVVAGIRQKRRDGWLLRKLPSRIANALIRRLTGVYLHDYGCTLKVFRKDIASGLGLYGELHRFIPVLCEIQGARMTELPVRHHPRIHGKSKYGLGRTFKVISDLLLVVYLQRWMKKPMHLFGTTGTAFIFGGLASYAFLSWKWLFTASAPAVADWAPGSVFLLGGLLLIAIGFLAEIQLRSYYEGQSKTPYTIRKVFRGTAASEPV